MSTDSFFSALDPDKDTLLNKRPSPLFHPFNLFIDPQHMGYPRLLYENLRLMIGAPAAENIRWNNIRAN
jgi:hypothetical protein